MPLVIHPRIRRNARRVVLLTALASLGVTGAAQAACPDTPTVQPFLQFGDKAHYEIAPGGSFEAGAPGWTLNGNSIVAGNESFFANADGDSQALNVASGSTVVSAPFCVDIRSPFLRLFARQAEGATATASLSLLYKDATGVQRSARVGRLSQTPNGRYTDWSPSPLVPVSLALPLWRFSGWTMNVQLQVTADTAGAWSIDDVFIDPYRA
jgi:hypothetical protein